MGIATILAIFDLIKVGLGVTKEIIPIFIHHAPDGSITKIQVIALLNAGDQMDMDTLQKIANANAGK